MQLYPGTTLLKHRLSIAEQESLLAKCQELASNAAGFYKPVVRGGAYMSVEMMCLGRHWNAKTYRYEASRTDYDGLPVQPIPQEFKALARRVAREAEMEMEPDICIVNHYSPSAKLGIHQDKEERKETLEAGIPVVSISLGDTAQFLIGGTRRKDPLNRVLLESGDVLVMGGPSRLRFHGVSRILPGTAPPELGVTGRYNLTFRQY
jgi:DNA alkylation damage repair protein AlkB